ncbi:hypothetical protein DPMN_076042 [Dreissena polymorpha]|uniref:Uncharacterized protein n=1 Tax=Dreissena polymorpha TaxID=45954 RepID=A0A9D4BM20_DREPO|nr:hypothetical protein DPMN_076042 [Dreissena polymorpha]
MQAAVLDQCACASSFFYVPPGEKVCSLELRGNDCKMNVPSPPPIVCFSGMSLFKITW